jgi:hypothetical protein
MSYARVRRQETKFSDVTAIGQSAEGVVAARRDEEDLHGAIRRHDFEFRLDKMPSHGIFPSKCSRIRPAFQARRRFLSNHPGGSRSNRPFRVLRGGPVSLDQQPVESEDQLRPRHFITVAFWGSLVGRGWSSSNAAARAKVAGLGVPVSRCIPCAVACPSLPTMSPST